MQFNIIKILRNWYVLKKNGSNKTKDKGIYAVKISVL